MGELDPMFGGSTTSPDMIAYDQMGNPFLGTDGFARVVVPGDFRGGRYVSNLVSLVVIDAVPEPASLLLLAGALTAIGLLRCGVLPEPRVARLRPRTDAIHRGRRQKG